MGRIRDLTGQRFGLLIARSISGKASDGSSVWLCECDCGDTTNVSSSELRRFRTKSCGCLRSTQHKVGSHNATKHDLSTTSEYRAWGNLQQKGLLPAQWEEFSSFLFDLGIKPTKRHMLSRRDNRQPHSKENTYWRNTFERESQPREITVIDFRTRTVSTRREATSERVEST